MNFNEYWKEKAAKRRKTWVSKAKRFADQHTQLESIRKEVYPKNGLRAALEDKGADMSSFRMEVSQQTIKGMEALQPKNRWEQSPVGYMPNKGYDYT